MNDLIRKLILIFVVLAVFAGFVLWFVTYYWVPKAEEKFGKIRPPEIQSVVSSRVQVVSDAQVSSVKIPQAANVYEKKPQVQEKSIAERFGFKSDPQNISGEDIWKEGNKTLIFKLPSSRFSFSDGTGIKTESFNQSQATSEAESFVTSLGLVGNKNSLSVLSTNYLLSGKSESFKVGSNQKFNIFSIQFGVKKEGFNLSDANGNFALVTVWVGKDGAIKKILADSQSLEFGNSSTYKIKSLKTAIKEIKNGKGIVVSTNNEVKSNEKIGITYTKVQLVYFLGNQKEKYLQPVYLFSGVGITGSLKSIEITALLPAVEIN